MTHITHLPSAPCKSLFAPIENDFSFYVKKPKFDTGLWSSFYVREERITYWAQFCEKEMPYKLEGRQAYRLTPAPTARILQLKHVSEVYSLLSQYRLSFPADHYLAFLAHDNWQLDFECLAQHYDAISIMPGLPETNELLATLNWDLPSTLWLNWCFEE